MALILAKEQPSGNSAEYHKIASVNIDWDIGMAEIQVISFKDKAARDAEPRKTAVTGKIYAFTGDDFTGFDHSTNNTIVAYNKLKANEDFEGAEDDV